ncbi:hypothetical protein N0B51_10270 [Tsuneonella sp. YG55]|uniref:Tetratricopeptide repeat protein n=1 Tax=Tsuneonella litorea TaxID=2976475 RepID=A0A9X2W2H9_9SPHN|nr:hypothetical protein [Tsuneonella litorea]MCT2559363.1 hypothetical protein [Tsuneonella litorea]
MTMIGRMPRTPSPFQRSADSPEAPRAPPKVCWGIDPRSTGIPCNPRPKRLAGFGQGSVANRGLLMRKTVFARAVSGACLAAMATHGWAATPSQERHIIAIPAIPGESYLIDLDSAQGYVADPKTGAKHAAQSFSFDLMEKENVVCRYTTDIDLVQMGEFEQADRVNGPRPGWKPLSGWAGKGGPKVQPCGFGSGVSKAGKYELTFYAKKSDVAGKVRVYFYNALEAPDDEMIKALVANAKPVRATDLAGKPAMSRGRPIFAADLPPGGREWVDAKPEALRPFYSALLRDGEYNAVGNFSKLGVAAIASGEYDTAKWALDQALDRIEAIYANDAAAKAARSKFSLESIKDFKGDPYERAMAYYYRGLLFLREGDYGNARASFVSAEYQDTVSESEEFQSDFALMNYLAGWSAQCMGNTALARDSFAAAANIDARLAAPAPKAKTLVIAESGQGPVKLRRGKSAQLVTLAPSMDYAPTTAPAPTLANASLTRAGDMTFQATTRGGRAFDAIMNGKVAYKDTMNTISDVASVASGLLADKIPGLGMLSMFGGLGAGALADATKTQADVRYWDTLPDAVFVTAVPVAGGVPTFGSGAPAATMTQVGKQACNLTWATDRSAAAAKAGIPGTPKLAPEWRAKKPEAAKRDADFRAALLAGTI